MDAMTKREIRMLRREWRKCIKKASNDSLCYGDTLSQNALRVADQLEQRLRRLTEEG